MRVRRSLVCALKFRCDGGQAAHPSGLQPDTQPTPDMLAGRTPLRSRKVRSFFGDFAVALAVRALIARSPKRRLCVKAP